MNRAWRQLLFAVHCCFWLACAVCKAASPSPGQSLDLAWLPSPGADVVGYRVYYGQSSRRYTKTVDAGGATSAVVNNLVSGFTYFFAVTAYNDIGLESLPSDEISYTVPGAAPGVYSGLFSETGGPQPGQAGSFSIVLTAGGTYSGRLQSGAMRMSFSGKLTEQAAVAKVGRPGASTLSLQMTFGSGVDAGSVSGQVGDGLWSAVLEGYRTPYNARSMPAPAAGRYTLVLPGQTATAGASAGDGFGIVRVTPGGNIRLGGVLADGTRFTQGGAMTQPEKWPLFVSSYAGQGLVMGWIGFQSGSDFAPGGLVTWIKPPAPKAIYESAGVSNVSQAFGSRYTASPGSAAMVGGAASFGMTFTGGDLAGGFTNRCVMVNSSHAVSQTANALWMNFSKGSGVFRGRVAEPGTGRWLMFSGAMLQDQGAGYGFVLAPSRSGQVMLIPGGE